MAVVRNPPAKPPMVLMVDDDRDDIFLTQRAFKAIDWQGRFQAVESAEELYAHLGMDDEEANGTSRENYPDIVILDLNMPGTNGFDVLRAVRSNPKLAALPIVVMTTSELPADIQKAYSLGANSFISKPTSAHDMSMLAERFRDYWFELTCLPGLPVQV